MPFDKTALTDDPTTIAGSLENPCLERDLFALFAERAAARPEAPALDFPGGGWTYGELREEAERLGRILTAQGVRPESRVALCFKRPEAMVAATLAIVRAGGAYVPLDPSHPAERLRFLVEDSGASLLLTEAGLLGEEAAPGVPVLFWPPVGEAESLPNPVAPIWGGDRLAYLIYTSGSTGAPKGVAVPHRAVVRLVRDTDYAQLGPDDRVAQASNTAFDAATFEIWGALLNGGCLVALDRSRALAPAELAYEIAERRITTLFLTTALFNQVSREVPHAFSPLRHLLFGGEAVDPESVRRILESGPPARLLHVYGPTESTTFATWERVVEVRTDAETVPIGGPIAWTSTQVLRPDLTPAAAGEPGELYLGGLGLARGYWRRPELTAERFVPAPAGAGEGAGARLYRTGDRVTVPGGRLVFAGRIDRQIKLRGFRIELGEVEAALARSPGVAAAVADTVEARPGDRRLVAWVTLHAGAVQSEETLRAALASHLPEPMVPAAILVLERFPLSSNGKVDRPRLPRPHWGEASGDYLAPRGPLEERLARVWSEVLGVPRVGAGDDFFDLGGHSLLAFQALSRLREEDGLDLSLEDLFEAPTIAALASRIGEAGAPELLAPVSREGNLPLSLAEEQLWLLDQLHGGAAYNIPFVIRLSGPLAVPRLAAVLARLATRHESLRTAFPESAGGAVRRIDPPAPRALPVIDLSSLPEARREAGRLAAGEASRPFDLAAGPVMRDQLLRFGETEYELLVNVHHIAFDGASLALFHRELGELYGGADEGVATGGLGMADFAAWQRRFLASPAGQAQLEHWRGQLAGLSPLVLPADRPRSAAAPRGGIWEQPLPAGLAGTLPEVARREARATPFMGWLAGFAALLHRLSGSTDFALGTPVALRDRGDLAPVIGFLVNTVTLRLDLSGEPSFTELLARVRRTAIEALRHQQAPFEKVVEAVNPERQAGSNPLFQVAFSSNPRLPDWQEAGVSARLERLRVPSAKFDLSLELAEEGDGLSAFWEYRRDLFERSTVGRFAARFEVLLAELAAHPERPIGSLAVMPEGERHQVACEWNDAATAYPQEATLPELFALQVARQPDAAALVSPSGILTYRELDERSDALAARLLELGVAADDRVGVLGERSPRLIVAFLGIVKAGAAYLPLDPSHPGERLAGMLEDGETRVLIAEGQLLERLPQPAVGLRVVDLGGEPSPPSPLPRRERGASARPSSTPLSLAYVIYTSGSTGRPKGVAVPHRAVVRLVLESDYVSLGPEDRVAQLSNASFDAATFEIWGALLNGGRLVFLGRDEALTPELFAAALARERISALFITTALFNWLASAAPACFGGATHLLFGGEAVDPNRVAEVLAAGPPRRLLHVYGPTENTTFSTWHRLTAVPAGAWTLPIGQTLANSSAFLLDPNGELVPDGSTGEIHVGGDGLARGYQGRPDLTAERFVPAPRALGLPPGGRLYRTGDLARRLPHGGPAGGAGAIEFGGRVDAQVKIRGFRIEPAEIEAALGAHPDVAECIVIPFRKGSGELALAAWLAARRGRALETSELRRFLGSKVPEYMVPAAFTLLSELPRNPNGKIDRAALPSPHEAEGEGRQARPTRSPTEEILAHLWGETLERGEIGNDDDFFAAGGHSLLATRLMARVRALWSVELPLSALFEAPTVARLAARIDEALAGGEGIEPLPWPPPRAEADATGAFPASPAQRGLWFQARVSPDEPFLNVLIDLRLRGPLSIPALAAALGALAARHEPLRATFDAVAGQPVQRIAPVGEFPLPLVDLAGLPARRREVEARRLAVEQAARPFDLARGPIARAVLVREDLELHLLAFTVHHLSFDGWSVGVFYRELEEHYGAVALTPGPSPETGEGNPVGTGSPRSSRCIGLGASPSPVSGEGDRGGEGPPLRFLDFAAWQGSVLSTLAMAAQRTYWRHELAELPKLELPADRPRPQRPTFRGGWVQATLPPADADSLEAACRRHGATLFMVLVAVYQVLLSRLTGQQDFGVGSPVSGRNRAELQGLIGFFVNLAVLRADLSQNPSFPELVARVRRSALGAYAHSDLPFETLVEDLQPQRDAGGTPLFEAALSLEQPPPLPRLPGLAAEALELEADIAHFDLTLVAIRAPEGLTVELNYRSDRFDRPTGGRWLEGFLALATAAATADAAQPAADLPLLPPAAWQQLVHEWNDTGAPLAPFATIHAWVEHRARLHPDKLALEALEGRLTYGQLDAAAGRLARRLRELGVGLEGRVALCFPPSLALAVGALAAVKAGGSYLPLDPQAPPKRLAQLAAQARVAAVITSQERSPDFAEGEAAVLMLDSQANLLPGRGASPSPVSGEGDRGGEGPGPDHLAYLLYTSGSTGEPKGVEVTHRGLVNLAAWTHQACGIRPEDRASWVTNPAFDVSVWELWTYLTAGVSLHIPPPGLVLDARELYAWLAAEEVSLSFLATPIAERVLRLAPPPGLRLRFLLTGGDRLRWGAVPEAEFTLLNVYGPTEATVVVTTAAIAREGEADRPPTIGRPLSATEVFVLDPEGRLAPFGAQGELFLGGVGLARGYAHRPDLTAERFVPHPVSEIPGARLYKTGDRVRFLPDGRLDFLGRNDHQVKVRGFRVELGEIESVLCRHEDVAEAVVLVRDTGSGAGLVAWFVTVAGRSVPEAEALRQFLRERLPAYMVPGNLVPMAAIPLTSRGKVDRKALPDPAVVQGAEGPPRSAGSPPPALGGLAGILAGLWREVLGLSQVGEDDNFFDLGGHSLALVAVHEKLESALGRKIPLVDLLENTTIRSLCDHLEGKGRPRAAEEPAARGEKQRGPSAWGERARAARKGKTP